MPVRRGVHGCHSVTWGALGEGLPNQVTFEQSPKGRELALLAEERAYVKALGQNVAGCSKEESLERTKFEGGCRTLSFLLGKMEISRKFLE